MGSRLPYSLISFNITYNTHAGHQMHTDLPQSQTGKEYYCLFSHNTSHSHSCVNAKEPNDKSSAYGKHVVHYTNLLFPQILHSSSVATALGWQKENNLVVGEHRKQISLNVCVCV